MRACDVERYKAMRLISFQRQAEKLSQVVAAAVSAKIQGQVLVFDDEASARRWCFNPRGLLISTYSMKHIKAQEHFPPWRAGIRRAD